MYRPIFRIVTVLYFWNQSQCDFFHMLLDVSKPHPPTSQLIGFSIGVRNDPRKIFIIKTMDFNSIYLGLVQKRQEYQNLYISYKKGLSVQHAAPRPAWPPPLSVGWCLFLSVYHWCTLMKSGDKVLHLSR